jgi:hypothetical protein
MTPIHPLDPVCLSAEARIAEIASILAGALIRLRSTAPHSKETPKSAGFLSKPSDLNLDLCGSQSVHSNPLSQVRNAALQSRKSAKRTNSTGI